MRIQGKNLIGNADAIKQNRSRRCLCCDSGNTI